MPWPSQDPDRSNDQPQTSNDVDDDLQWGLEVGRGGALEDRGHSLPADDDSRAAWQGRQGSLHVVVAAALK